MQLLTARLACVAMVVLFVGGLYLVPSEVRTLPRDDPGHIRARFAAVSAATLLSVLALGVLLRDESVPENALEWVGLPPHGLLPATFLPLMLTASLFLGPLATTAMYLHRWRREAPSRVAASVWQWTTRTVPVSWTSALQADLTARVGATPEEQLRTLVVGPLSEEVVFRGCMLPLLVVAGHRPLQACLECPLVFGTQRGGVVGLVRRYK
jgi:prenyl protein peptidase|eukprot:COSAG03_NODE_61_length_15487_cov_34.600143_1_plen_210_part_00